MTQISRLIGEVVPVTQRVTGDESESAHRGGGFVDYALVSLHCLWIYLDMSYRMTIDLLKEMQQITKEIGRCETDLLRAVHVVLGVRPDLYERLSSAITLVGAVTRSLLTWCDRR